MRQTVKGEVLFLAFAETRDKRSRSVRLGFVSSKSKAGGVAKLRRKYGKKYRNYHVV